MSRGHGSVQGTVLAILGRLRNGGRGLDTISIASRVYRAVAPSKAQHGTLNATPDGSPPATAMVG
jgi:hypothetical protein